MQYLAAMFTMLLGQLPQIIIWIVGIALAVSRQKQAPRQARLALIAFVGFLLLAIAGAFANSYFSIMVIERGVARATAMISAANIVLSIVSAGLWVLLLMALFAGKSAEIISFDGLG